MSDRLARSLLLATLLAAGCGPRGEASTPADGAQANPTGRDEAAFARAVASEPASPRRLAVASVAGMVLVSADEQRVYALEPSLVALDRRTGNEIWKLSDASGDLLLRFGANLAVLRGNDTRKPTLVTVDPSAGAIVSTCPLGVPAPVEANSISVHPFDRAGGLFIHWQSWAGWDGGTPPPATFAEQQRVAKACGIVRFDPATCKLSPERSFPGFDSATCHNGSATFTLPAAAAAAPKAYGPTLSVETAPVPSHDGCRSVTKVTLHAQASAGSPAWSRPLADAVRTCGPP